jgi:crotonobetainyl-CoA:carnitine CoA-transferase CaiB-like acyl-CoA transferase
MDIFARADVPVVPVNEGAAVAEDPHMLARIEWLAADQGAVTMKSPVRSDPPIAAPGPAPSLGRDTADILGQIAVGPAELERLVAEKIIRVGQPPSAAAAENSDNA